VKPAAVKEEFSQLVRYNEETKRKATLQTSYVAEQPEADTLLERKGHQTDGTVPAAPRWKCLGTARDLLRPPTLRPLSLVIPFFFFVHWSGMTAIRPYMVHVFGRFHVPIDPNWATVSCSNSRVEPLTAMNSNSCSENNPSIYFNYCILFSPSLFLFSFSGWGETESTWYVGHCFPIVPAPDDR
jgi:hypothetical protein